MHKEGEILSSYLDGALSLEERRAVENHVPGCTSCRGELESLRRVKTILSQAPKRPLPAGLELQARPSRSSARFAVPTMAAAALIVSLWLGLSRRATEEIPLGPLLAAHARYSGETLIPQEALSAPNFFAELAQYKSDE